MNWETTGWVVIAASLAVIVFYSFFASNNKATASSAAPTADDEVNPWLEIAWPALFIAAMGMLTFKEVVDFSGVLLLATVITGIVWFVDAKFFRSRRVGKSSALTQEVGAAVAPPRDPVLVEMCKSFFPVILIVFVLRSFLYEPFKIPSGSMVPSLLIGDFILVNKYEYGVRLPVINKKIVENNQPQRGDVMVFRYPPDPAKAYIKRVIGLPGDVVTYKDKRLTINGNAIEVTPVGRYTESDNQQMRFFDTFSERLGKEPHLMMTDPQYPSLGLASVEQFPHRQNCEYNEGGMTCKVPAGHYFMMGDSRDNSLDGRYWGFVPDENIVGKAVSIWMNFGAFDRVFTRIR